MEKLLYLQSDTAQRFISVHGHLLMERLQVFKTCTNAIIILCKQKDEALLINIPSALGIFSFSALLIAGDFFTRFFPPQYHSASSKIYSRC